MKRVSKVVWGLRLGSEIRFLIKFIRRGDLCF